MNDAITYTWECRNISALPYKFAYGDAVVYKDEIHILGGIYNTATSHYKWTSKEKWEEVSTIPYKFCQGKAVIYQKDIHILGTAYPESHLDHYIYDDNWWHKLSVPLPEDSYIDDAIVYDDKIYITISNLKKLTSSLYMWDNKSWTLVDRFPYKLCNIHMAVLHNTLYIFGMSVLMSTRTFCYKLHKGSLEEMNCIPYVFYRGSIVTYHDRICIFGGMIINRGILGGYSWDGKKWDTIKTPYGITGGSAVVYEDAIHLLGGLTSSTFHSKVSINNIKEDN